MDTTVRWLGRGGYLLKNETASFAIDPFRGSAPNTAGRDAVFGTAGEPVDLVLCTHDHLGRLDPASFRDVAVSDRFAGPVSCLKALRRADPGLELLRFERGVSVSLGGFTITASAAIDTADSVGYLVETEDVCLYFTGETSFTAELLLHTRGFRPDVTLLNIDGGRDGFGCREAASFCKFLGTKTAVPGCRSGEESEAFRAALARTSPQTACVVLEKHLDYTIDEILFYSRRLSDTR